MKTLRVGLVCIALTLLMGRAALAQTGHDLLQQALVMEQAEGDLQAAIDLYERIVQEFEGDGALAARALVQMGQCYEKLGSQEAERAYQRVVSDYADQVDLVALARRRMALLRGPEPSLPKSSIVARHIWGGTFAAGPDGGPDANGGPSPDGRYLAYVDWRTGDLALRDLVTGESRRLTSDGGYPRQLSRGYAFEAHFAPDGRQVAYSWFFPDEERYELRVVGLDGSPPRVLFRDSVWNGGFTWSHDGSRVVTTRELADGTMELFLVSTEDGSTRPLWHFDEGFDTHESFSPADRYVALSIPEAGNPSNFDIWLIATDGSGVPFPIVEHPAADWSFGWIPGSRDLLFSSDRSGTEDLWAVEVDEGEVMGPPRPVRRDVGISWSLGFSEDGSFFYANYTRRFNIFLVPFDLRTGEIDLSRSEPLLGSNIGAIWSPDGAFLAMVRPGGYGEAQATEEGLILRDMETGEERRLAATVHVSNSRMEWSPDGRSILAYGRGGTGLAEGRSALWLVDVATGEAEAVVDLPEVIQGIWASDGRSIIYANRGRIVLRDADSGRERDLYRDPMLASRLIALSPDGQWLAVGLSTDPDFPLGGPRTVDGGRLLLVPTGGGEARELATIDLPGRIRNLYWAPDGEGVLFWLGGTEGVDDGATLFRAHRDGGVLEEIWTTEEEWGYMAHNPDFDRVAYTLIENEMDIWVMEKLGGALRESGGGR